MRKHTYIMYHQKIDDGVIRLFFVTKNCKESWFFNFHYKGSEKDYNANKEIFGSEYDFIYNLFQYKGFEVFVPKYFSFSYFNNLEVRKEF